MKKLILLSTVIFFIKTANAQQRPQYTQYISNYFLINPAFAGTEKDINITASYRKQWAGLYGSPSTSYLTFNRAFLNNEAIKDDSVSLKDNAVLYSLYKPHHAIGVTFINDKQGALNRSVGYATYAYHLQLSSKMNLSAGLSAGFSSLRVHEDKLGLETSVDPAVNNFTGRNKFDMNAGILLYGKKFFAGISLQQILPENVKSNVSSINMYGDRKFPDLFISGGYRLKINNEISFTPSAMVKYLNTVPTAFDLNAKFDYQDLVWAGYSYRYKSGMAAMVGVKIKDGIKFSYSYDITTSGLQAVSNGTHELQLAFIIKGSN